MMLTILAFSIASLLLLMPFVLLEPIWLLTALALGLAVSSASVIAVIGEMWLRRTWNRG